MKPGLYELIWNTRPLLQRIERAVQRGLEGTDLTVRMRAVMEILGRDGAQTVPALARALEIQRQYVQIMVDETTAASLWGGDQRLPVGPLPISPAIDLEHRLLLTAARRARDVDADELYEHAISLASTALTQRDPHRGASGRPTTQRARSQIVNDTRELLANDPNQSLPELAQELAVSPHHLSRTFRSLTGHTISQHRLLLRVRAASERLNAGERDLARLSADLGFADQSHLSRAIHQQTGHTPSMLRQLLTQSLA